MKRKSSNSGVAVFLRFGEWCRGQNYLLHMTSKEAAAAITQRFGVSRATSYRWLSAWRDVSAEFIRGSTSK